MGRISGRGNPIIATPARVAAGELTHRITNGVGCRPYFEFAVYTSTTGWQFYVLARGEITSAGCT